ncbi:MAG: nitrilase [Pseudomonadota bacterium]|nr:nitrilase [Pseudomonadota bacterium]
MSTAAQASPETLTVALWAANLEPPAVSLAAWIAAVEARLAEVQAGGASLLVLPELACVQWLGFAPAGLALDRQVPWLAAVAREAVAALRPLPARYGVALLAGSMPFALEAGQGHANRAWLLLPDGRAFFQDKLYLTPSEQNPHGWQFTPGRQINVVVWNGLRLGIAVCLDVEATALWARLATLDLDLILVPAKTDLIAGYYRVFGCAKARAVELQTVVCAVGAVGTAFGQPLTDTVVGGAAAFIPCEARLGHTGVAAALEPHGPLSGASPLLYAPHLPVGLCRRIRHGEAEAEVWPGSWPAHHVIADPAIPVP